MFARYKTMLHQHVYYANLTEAQFRQKTEQCRQEIDILQRQCDDLHTKALPQAIQTLVPLFLHAILRTDYALKVGTLKITNTIAMTYLPYDPLYIYAIFASVHKSYLIGVFIYIR